MNHSATLNPTLVKSLQMHRVVPFVGAGISIWQPSGMPTGYELLEAVLRGLTPPSMPNSLRKHLQKVYSYSPEIIFQAIYEYLPDKSIFFNIYKAFEDRQPNICHVILANAFSERLTALFTTNQDCLLEEASGNSVKSIFSEGDFMLSDNKPQIFKLHGTSGGVTDSERLTRSTSIQFTLNQMGAGLSPNKTRLIQHVFARHPLLFIGYSGADYDICNFLFNELDNRDRVIYWNVRPGTNVESLQPHLWSLYSRYPDQIVIIEMDIRDLFIEIAKLWSISTERSLVELAYKENVHTRVPTNRYLIQRWAVGLPEFYKILILGWILFSTNVPTGAEEAAKLAITLSSNDLEKGIAFLLLGHSCREQSRHAEALRHLTAALKYFNAVGDLFRQAQALHKIAESSSTLEMMRLRHLLPLSRFHYGIRTIKEAIRLYECSEHDNVDKTMQRATLGWALLNETQILIRIGWFWRHFVPLFGRYVSRWCLNKGKTKLQRAMDVLSKSGDLRGVAQGLIALADIEPHRNHAELGGNVSSRWTVDLVHQGNSLIRQCLQNIAKGNVNSAITQCKMAIERYQHLGVQAEISRAAAIMVNLGLKIKDRQMTDEYLTLCIEALRKTRGSYLFNMVIMIQIWRGLFWGFIWRIRRSWE